MNTEQKYLANLAIDRWCKDSTARQIVRYVMECELWGQDTVNPTNVYLSKKYGWTLSTTESAIKLAKKSQFITTTGYRNTRRFELNVGYLKGKMAEIVAQKPIRNIDFTDVLPPQLPPFVPPQLPPVEPPDRYEEYGLCKPSYDENGGYNNKNKNKNTSGTGVPRIVSFSDGKESTSSVGNRFTKKYQELCSWMESLTGVKFVDRRGQYKALKLARESNIGIERLKERAQDMKASGDYELKGMDWFTVVYSFNKKA